MNGRDPLCRAGNNHKIREPLAFAPVELALDEGGRRVYVPGAGSLSGHNHRTQAQRCPRCKALFAVGDSYQHHIFWCVRADGRQS